MNSNLTKKFVVSNIGDIPARFHWDLDFCKYYFNITPKKGFIPSHEEFSFDVTFHPTVVPKNENKEIKFE